jgi:hypothetical protein
VKGVINFFDIFLPAGFLPCMRDLVAAAAAAAAAADDDYDDYDN